MIRARVTGRIWSSKRIQALPKGPLLTVETEGGESFIAFDPLGCAEGEAVLIARGSVAANYFADVAAPIDALIIGSIDEDG